MHEDVEKDLVVYKAHRLILRNPKTRGDARRRLIQAFLTERRGRGRGELASRYRYNVERLADGRWVFLRRPSRLNKGFDFEIWVEGWWKGKDRRPSHNDIRQDLVRKRRESRAKFRTLRKLIGRIYALQEPSVVLRRTAKPRFRDGLSLEFLLNVLKWMFIEQDMTYWNYSGRDMLKRTLDKDARLGRLAKSDE